MTGPNLLGNVFDRAWTRNINDNVKMTILYLFVARNRSNPAEPRTRFKPPTSE
jgi:hypothetical protein